VATSTDSSVCTASVSCPPHVSITKQVACAPSTASGLTCATIPGANYGALATGVQGTTCPSFCYKIVITNDGADALQTVVLNDPDLSNFSPAVPATLAVGASFTTYASKVWCANDAPAPSGHVNTATVTATGTTSGTSVTAQASATVVVNPITLTCDLELSSTTFTPGGQPVQVTLNLHNPSTIALDVAVTGLPNLVDCATGSPTTVTQPIHILPGTTTMAVTLGCLPVTCPGGTSFTLTVVGTAVDTASVPCIFDSNGNPITTAPSTCPASVTCPQAGCTPGFWKNCTGQWPISTSTMLGSVYNISSCVSACGYGNISLMQALSLKGGSGVCGASQILLRAAASAYLNSLKLTYPIKTADLVSQVNAALASCDRNTMLTLAGTLDADNNLGCNDANGKGLPCRR